MSWSERERRERRQRLPPEPPSPVLEGSCANVAVFRKNGPRKNRNLRWLTSVVQQVPKRGGSTCGSGGGSSPASGGHLCVDGVSEAHVERVVVLHQGGLLVVEHQLLQAAVQVVRLGEAEAPRRAEDHAVLHLPFHTEDRTAAH